jgi:peptidyl-prolyl cis-trans isomerase SurA
MIKKLVLIIFLFLSVCFTKTSVANISIIASVDGEIITNYDLKKESDYLTILNPNLSQLDNDQVLKLAMDSLINEIIKKKEIKKFFKKKENLIVDQYLKNLYSKLNFNSEEEFKIFLKQKDSFTLDEIKEKIKVELFWNKLIYSRYKNLLKVDRKSITQKVKNLDSNKQNEYLLSEISFIKKKNLPIENLINEIRMSINEIGFNNTANIYSNSDSSKLGGKLGWINENSLSKNILKELKLINEGEYTNIIKLNNNYLIIQVEKIRTNEFPIDKKQEIEKLILVETNKQLNKFSKIYFDKSKMNYSINEK